MYSTHCFGQKNNSISMFQSCNEFQKHCRGRSILTPEDPQRGKKMWGNAKEIAKCATSYKNCQYWVLLYILYDQNVSVCVLYLQPLLFCIFLVNR